MGKRVLASTGRPVSCSTAPVMRLERLSKALAKASNTSNEGPSDTGEPGLHLLWEDLGGYQEAQGSGDLQKELGRLKRRGMVMHSEAAYRRIGLHLLDTLDRGELLGDFTSTDWVALKPWMFEPHPPGDRMDDVKPVRRWNTVFLGRLGR